MNPGCPLVQAAAEATMTKVPLRDATKEPMEIASVEGYNIP